MVVCNDQKLGVILSDDDAGTAARDFVGLGLSKPGVALVDLGICDRYDRRKGCVHNRGDILNNNTVAGSCGCVRCRDLGRLPDGLVYLGALVRQQGVGRTVDSVHRSAGYDTEEERCRRDKSCRLGIGVFLRSVVAVSVSVRILSMSLIIVVLLIRVRVPVLVSVILLMLLPAVVTVLAVRISVIRLAVLCTGTKSSVDLSSCMLTLRLLGSVLGVLSVLRVYRLFIIFLFVFIIYFVPFIFIIHNRNLLSVLKFSMFLFVLKDSLFFFPLLNYMT